MPMFPNGLNRLRDFLRAPRLAPVSPLAGYSIVLNRNGVAASASLLALKVS